MATVNLNNAEKYIAAGGLAGAGAGMLVSAQKTGKILKSYGITKGMTQDQYVSSRIEKNLENIMNSAGKSRAKVMKMAQKVAQKASEDFTNISAKAAKAFKNKGKWIAGLAAAGIAIGALGAVVVNKVKESKEDQQ